MLILTVVTLFALKDISSASNVNTESQFLSVVATTNADLQASNFTESYISLFQLALSKQRNSLDNDLWILIPVILVTFLLACLITLLCYLIQPKLDNHIARTSSTIFKQGSQPAWVHSGSKVEKLREPWWTGRAVEQLEPEDNVDQKRRSYVDATTETSTGPPVEEHSVEKVVEDLESNAGEPVVDLEQVRPTEEDESQHADISVDSSESGAEIIQTQPVVSPFPDTVGNVLSSTAPPRINSDEPMSLYDLWYFYRAFDHTQKLDEESLEKELTLPKMPSEFSESLEFRHPDLLEDPMRAIMEQTGKVPPSQRPSKSPESLDDSTVSSVMDSVDNLVTMGTKLYPKEGDQLYGSTLRPVNTHRKDSKEDLHDEIDIAASVRFAPEAVNSSTFKHMQAELRRIYSEPNVEKDSGPGKGEQPEIDAKDVFNDLESVSSDSF
ncbi:uncharacterized protein LOC142337653 isoform X2 [Convolutriloba macropyga]|uniref:uncharacterized protein LOC142337653 isoform X2 n=1 Tax=Convolutriloba macropyga TaxID=536237 RepID=UPI003F528A9E